MTIIQALLVTLVPHLAMFIGQLTGMLIGTESTLFTNGFAVVLILVVISVFGVRRHCAMAKELKELKANQSS